MPTILPNPIADAAIRLKWREPYVSLGLNQAIRGMMGRGVVRGFRVAAGAGVGQIQLLVDPAVGDSVILAGGSAASAGEALAYRETSAIIFTMTGVVAPSVSAILACRVNYQQSITTTADWRVYTEAEYLANQHVTDKAVVLCRFTMPALAAPITDFDTSIRDDLWKSQGHGVGPHGDDVVLYDRHYSSEFDSLDFNLAGSFGTNMAVSTTTSLVAIGPRALEFATSGGAGDTDRVLVEYALTRLGDEFIFRMRYATVQLTAGESIRFRLEMLTASGASTGDAALNLFVVPPTLGTAEFFEGKVQIPTTYSANLAAVRIRLLITIPDPQQFILETLLITAKRGASTQPGAPDTSNRELLSPPTGKAVTKLRVVSVGAGASEFWDIDYTGGQLNIAPVGVGTPNIMIGDVAQASDILVSGRLTFLGAINALNTYHMYITSAVAHTRRQIVAYDDSTYSNTARISSRQGSLELVSGGDWSEGGLQWFPSGANDIVIAESKSDGFRVRTYDTSQFGSPGVEAELTQPLYIPTLKQLATEDPDGKATPKLKFDVRSTSLGANLIMENRQGTTGQAHRIYEFGNGLTNSQVWETVNAVYSHAADTYSGDTADQSTYRHQSNQIHAFNIIHPTYDAYPVAAGTYSASLYFTMNGARPELVILKGANQPANTATRLNATNQDFRVDFGDAASQTASTANAESTNPDSTLGMTATLRSKNVVKAWGIVNLPVGLNTPEALEDGFNVTSVDNPSPPGSRLVVTLPVGLASSVFSVNVTHDETGGGNAYACTWERINATSFYIYMYPMGSGARALPETATGRINFTVMGVQ